MNTKQLNRMLNLVRETGDRLLIADSSSDEVFAVMSLDEYENLAQLKKMDISPAEIKTENFSAPVREDLNEQAILERINRDIATWRGMQKNQEHELLVEDLAEATLTTVEVPTIETEPAEKPLKIEKKSAIPRIGDVLKDDNYRDRNFDTKPRVAWVEEEDLADVPHEEEKFYLEPVE